MRALCPVPGLVEALVCPGFHGVWISGSWCLPPPRSDHRDSRAGDPDLHTHLAISNKVRARHDHPDGTPRWLSLDARVLHAAAVAASERYDTRIEDALVRRLGVVFTDRGDTVREDKRVIREVTGIPPTLLTHFSKRRTAIEDRYRVLARDYRHTHGHEPPREAQLKLAQQATLETRDGKEPPRPLADKLTDWRREARTVLGGQHLAQLERDCIAQDRTPLGLSPEQLDQVARQVVTVVSTEKATWTRWNVTAETERQLRPHRFASVADREAATTLILDRVLDPTSTVQLTPDGLEADHGLGLGLDRDPAGAPTPTIARRSNGESVLVEHGSARYTTQDLLDAEQRLLDYAEQPTRHAIPPADLPDLLVRFERRHGVTLDTGQRTLVGAFLTDPRRLVAGIGPAGAGKTTAMRSVAETWRSTGHRVIPLAPSAAAAEVLGDELGCRAENLHKFRHTHETTDPAGLDPWFRLQPGDLVLIDEAGIAGTRHLDWVTHHARERGAVVRLLGDPAQLASVEAGGALRLIARQIPDRPHCAARLVGQGAGRLCLLTGRCPS